MLKDWYIRNYLIKYPQLFFFSPQFLESLNHSDLLTGSHSSKNTTAVHDTSPKQRVLVTTQKIQSISLHHQYIVLWSHWYRLTLQKNKHCCQRTMRFHLLENWWDTDSFKLCLETALFLTFSKWASQSPKMTSPGKLVQPGYQYHKSVQPDALQPWW